MNQDMTIPPYTRELSRQHPGLFVILLDQSSSMSERVKRGAQQEQETKAEMVTWHVNTIIQEMIDNAGVEEFNPGIRRKYAYLSVLGYNNVVIPLLANKDTPLDIPTLASHPRGEAPVVREVRDRSTGRVLRTITQKRKYWIEPAYGARTDMALAFDRARDVVAGWLNTAPEEIAPGMGRQRPRQMSFPPVVINVTDGYFTGRNPLRISEELQHLRTLNGNVLVFNCHFTIEDRVPCIFPKDVSEVRGIDPYGYAETMFEMSSVLPEPLRERASKTMRRPIEPGARCVVYNASPEILVQFLRWGTIDVSVATGTDNAM